MRAPVNCSDFDEKGKNRARTNGCGARSLGTATYFLYRLW